MTDQYNAITFLEINISIEVDNKEVFESLYMNLKNSKIQNGESNVITLLRNSNWLS